MVLTYLPKLLFFPNVSDMSKTTHTWYMQYPSKYHIHFLFGNEGARDMQNLKTVETVSDHTLLDGTALCGNSGIISDVQVLISSETQIDHTLLDGTGSSGKTGIITERK